MHVRNFAYVEVFNKALLTYLLTFRDNRATVFERVTRVDMSKLPSAAYGHCLLQLSGVSDASMASASTKL